MNATLHYVYSDGEPDREPRTILGAKAVLQVDQLHRRPCSKSTNFTIPRSHAAADGFKVSFDGGLDASHSNVVGTTERVRVGRKSGGVAHVSR